jgi:hypothetical protein
MNENIDGTGHAWHPREGDLVRDPESGNYGVVLSVKQIASAPAYAHVALDNGDGVWTVVEVDASQLERDTRGDVEVPALAAIELTLEEAAAEVLAEVQLLALYRARVQSSEELIGVLEIEAQRCLRVGDAAITVHRYDIGTRERERAGQLRWLAAAVRTIVAQTGCTPG